MTKILSARAHTVAILDCFEKDRLKLSSIYEKYFDSNKLNKKWKPEITHLVQEVMRQRAFLDYIISHLFMGNYESAESTFFSLIKTLSENKKTIPEKPTRTPITFVKFIFSFLVKM